MSNEKEQYSQIAVVTGAAGGFGREIVKDLLNAGFVVAATDLSDDALELLKSSLDNPAGLYTFIMDVVNVDSIQKAAGQIENQLGASITVLINNAGVFDKNLCLVGDSGVSAAAAKKVIDINLTGSFNCTTVFSKFMAKLKYGRIINIASAAGLWGTSMASAYAASKAGLIKASESWARELGPLNISVVAVAPGVCQTNMYSGQGGAAGEAGDKAAASYIPMRRLGTVEDISEVVMFLSTCKTNYLNSAIISIDGGMRVGMI